MYILVYYSIKSTQYHIPLRQGKLRLQSAGGKVKLQTLESGSTFYTEFHWHVMLVVARNSTCRLCER